MNLRGKMVAKLLPIILMMRPVQEQIIQPNRRLYRVFCTVDNVKDAIEHSDECLEKRPGSPERPRGSLDRKATGLNQ